MGVGGRKGVSRNSNATCQTRGARTRPAFVRGIRNEALWEADTVRVLVLKPTPLDFIVWRWVWSGGPFSGLSGYRSSPHQSRFGQVVCGLELLIFSWSIHFPSTLCSMIFVT
ncbi:hypothetical protein CDAR_526781 [Caerostris darwini]|uniref:Uncharacterized protein n=1 Tax=Caerostris darwini TaxID=1538125 RepID=A0AAV4Q669_9ARAC|nr:hypothetical protein CDAR_526781 [Caerostris darwini]